MNKKLITQEELKLRVHYDPITGLFTSVSSPSKRVKPGMPIGHMCAGYIILKIDGIPYRAHRLAILYMTGKFPDAVVDHINGRLSDNRYCNLRPCSHAENLRNRTATARNKSGAKGVYWHKASQKWIVSCTVNQKKKHIGLFTDFTEAVAAYNNHAQSVHGEFFKPSGEVA